MIKSKFDPQFWYSSNIEAILSFDYKEFHTGGTRIGMSTVLRKVVGWHHNVSLNHPSLPKVDIRIVIAGYRHCDIPGSSSGTNDPSIMSRELLILGLEMLSIPREKIIECLTEKFSLVRIDDSNDGVLLFQINDSSFSRKKFSPLFVKLLEGEKPF
jgi:hypothetical protein